MNTQHRITKGTFSKALLVVLGLAVGASACKSKKEGEETAPPIKTASEMVAPRLDATTSLLDPGAGFWDQAVPVRAQMMAQVAAQPNHPEPAVMEVLVRAVHNGDHVALRLDWKDDTKSDRIVVDSFGDQVALQFPQKTTSSAPPSPMMGQEGDGVYILQWRAAFEKDRATGGPAIVELYPNFTYDHYPEDLLQGSDARPYATAKAAGNPLVRDHAATAEGVAEAGKPTVGTAAQQAKAPVVAHIAEGWGTLTVIPAQPAEGKGVWKDGAWSVVISHPLDAGADAPFAIKPGQETNVALAIWDGGNQEVGGRKSWSMWLPLKLTE